MYRVTYLTWFIIGTELLCLPMIMASTAHNKYTYVLKIQTPPEMQQVNSWQCLYKGERLAFHSNLAKIVEKRCMFSFSIVITPDIKISTQQTALSSLRHIELLPGEPVRWFDLNLIFDKGSWKWEIIELTTEKIPTLIPPHAIILLFDPELVKSLEKPYKTAYCLDTLCEGGGCNFELPSIVLKGNSKQLEAALNYAPNAAVNVLRYHTTAPCETQIIDGIHCAVDVVQ